MSDKIYEEVGFSILYSAYENCASFRNINICIFYGNFVRDFYQEYYRSIKLILLHSLPCKFPLRVSRETSEWKRERKGEKKTKSNSGIKMVSNWGSEQGATYVNSTIAIECDAFVCLCVCVCVTTFFMRTGMCFINEEK